MLLTGQDEAERATASSDAPSASGGMAGNLVSAIRSFLPGGKAPEPQLAGGKKPVKVGIVRAQNWIPIFQGAACIIISTHKNHTTSHCSAAPGACCTPCA